MRSFDFQQKSPVGLFGRIAILAHYFGGYCWLYPVFFQWITNLIWGYDEGIFEWMGWIIYVGTLVVTMICCWGYYRESWKRFIHYGSEMLVELGVHEFLIIVCMIATGIVVSVLIGDVQSSNQQAVEDVLQTSPALMIFASCIMAPIVEESIFRGIFYRTLRTKASVTIATCVSCILFGFLHVYEAVFAGNVLELAYILVYGSMGYAFCHIYERTGTIHACIVLHMIHNSLTVWLMTLV